MNKRNAEYNVLADAKNIYSQNVLLDIFKKMCLVRFFEKRVAEAIQNKIITYPVYLSSGQEAVAAAFAQKISSFQTFTQHRAHDIFLCFGAPPELLADELLGLPTGTSGGRAGSNCIQYHSERLNIYGHHGLIGENVPQGVGAALANGRKTLCVFGDGSAEEDYVLASFGFAATHKLPVLFACIDNDLSILTSTATRRSWDIPSVAASFGLETIDCTDDPCTILYHTEQLINKLPALINIKVCRTFWHVGAGNDGPPEWDRFAIFKKELITCGLQKELEDIEKQIQTEMNDLWGKRLLQIPSEKSLKNI